MMTTTLTESPLEHATLMTLSAENLATELARQPWGAVQRWIDQHDPSLIERLQRLSRCDDEYRLDLIRPGQVSAQRDDQAHVSLYRATPKGGAIRPGDLVTLDQGYADLHLHGMSPSMAALELVDLDDVFWAGTDENEFLYLPKAWRLDGLRPEEHLKSLGHERLRILLQGEMHRISQHMDSIHRIQSHIFSHVYDAEACGIYHGPDHWNRVAHHGMAVARSMGIDPLVPYVFGLVHDSHREDEGYDLMHGPRAAEFVRRSPDFFAFLSPAERESLAHACALHSEGQTQGDPMVQACWDADRLDLWRVGIEPLPAFLCTPYARRPSTIAAASMPFSNAHCRSVRDRLERP